MSLNPGNNQKAAFETIYNKFSAPLYGIILKMSTNSSQAEEILGDTFNTYFRDKHRVENNELIFHELLKLSITIASATLNRPKKNLADQVLKDLFPVKYRTFKVA